MKAVINNFINDIRRYWWARKRNAITNNNHLNSAYKADDFIIRDAIADDMPQLIAVHVQVWNDTHRNVKQKPTYQTRERQWREYFKQANGGVVNDNQFCMVVTDPDNKVVGFTKGQRYKYPDLPDYDGELTKFYLLLPYQRLGLGKKLFCRVAKRLISMGVNSLVLFGVPYNPSCYFYQRMGGQRLYAKNGEFHGGFGWLDLKIVSELCK